MGLDPSSSDTLTACRSFDAVPLLLLFCVCCCCCLFGYDYSNLVPGIREAGVWDFKKQEEKLVIVNHGAHIPLARLVIFEEEGPTAVTPIRPSHPYREHLSATRSLVRHTTSPSALASLITGLWLLSAGRAGYDLLIGVLFSPYDG